MKFKPILHRLSIYQSKFNKIVLPIYFKFTFILLHRIILFISDTICDSAI